MLLLIISHTEPVVTAFCVHKQVVIVVAAYATHYIVLITIQAAVAALSPGDQWRSYAGLMAGCYRCRRAKVELFIMRSGTCSHAFK